MNDRRSRPVPELVERDLDGVPVLVLGVVLSMLDQLEAYRPLQPEELSTQRVVDQVRDGRNQLLEERFGSGTRLMPREHVPGPPSQRKYADSQLVKLCERVRDIAAGLRNGAETAHGGPDEGVKAWCDALESAVTDAESPF
uniref:Uncharacterized protein n=1 Tax=uncultured prokaryote TaxID=198431 RepID=A0A0H5Q576_9ZZZZ|nr:hypothetical protein [uncultured prokaryote]